MNDTDAFQYYHPVEFESSIRRFTLMWITNLALVLVTLGFYAPWAKVKRKQFYYHNTNIRYCPFDYDASPVQLLKWQLATMFGVAFAAFLFVRWSLDPLVLCTAVAIIAPFLVNWSLAFEAQSTKWNGNRFSWHGGYLQTFFFFIVAPVLSMLSLGILGPLLLKFFYKYFAGSHRLAGRTIIATPSLQSLYAMFFVLVLMLVFFVLVCFSLFTKNIDFFSAMPKELVISIAQLLPAFVVAAVYFVARVYLILCRGIFIRSLSIKGEVQFYSTFSPTLVMWIILSNWLMTTLSLGLLSAWGTYRLHRYFAKTTFSKELPSVSSIKPRLLTLHLANLPT